ncbi:hypothetical protein BGX23_004082 [Mortierella sp. AD031]|nr:hypothetical protein BGX23_004082 [Mortierella sp. AD031]
MEGALTTTALGATTAPTMDATTPAMDVSTPNNTLSPAVLNEAVTDNVKSIKRKVISVSKLMEIFKNKETEMVAVKKELEDAQATIAALQQAAAKVPTPDTIGIEELRTETELTKQKLKESEAQVSKLSQSLRSQQMLNHQLEEKTHGYERLTAEVLELQKKLIQAEKSVEKANRQRSTEVTQLREKLMKATAENTDKITWMTEHRKKWQEEEEIRKSKREADLEAKLHDLQNQLEDMSTERYLDMELAKEEVKTAEEKLQRSTKKVDELHEKQRTMARTIIDLRNENAELERRLEQQETGQSTEAGGVEEFEEVIPEQDSSQQAAPLAKPDEPVKSPQPIKVSKAVAPSAPSTPVQLDADQLPREQLDTALESLEQLKAQFSMLRWVGGSKNDKQRITALEEQVKTLTKERHALQETLTRQLTMAPYVPPQAVPPPAASTHSHSTIHKTTVVAPTADDTIARVEPSSTGKGKKRRVEEVEDLEMDLEDGMAGFEHDATTFPDDHGDDTVRSETEQDEEGAAGSVSSAVPATPATPPAPPAKRKPGRPKKNPDAVPEAPATKPKRKYTKRETKASTSTVDYSQLAIRNISVNSLAPSISNPFDYFSTLLKSPIVHDSQAHTKLDLIATILPAKLDALFDAIQKKIPTLPDNVKKFRKKENLYNDTVQTWALDGFEDIILSKFIAPEEVNIALLVCLLDTRFPEMDIVSKFFTITYESIMHGAAKEDHLPSTAVLVRVLTAICRSKNNHQLIQVLAYDILRETTIPKATLLLSEAIAVIWPAIYIIPEDAKANEDPRQVMFTTFQAVLGSLQAETPVGTKVYFSTFTKRCGWPASDAAPYMDEVAKDILEKVTAADFAEKCQATPGMEFTFRKALELLFVYGYDWDDLFKDVIKPTLFPQIINPTLHTFAMPLVASAAREARCKSSETTTGDREEKAEKEADITQPVKQLLNAILTADATVSHQAQSALAIVTLSNGQGDQLEDVRRWYKVLSEDERQSMPKVLQDVLA